ncbi:unnamed protein product [Closterium sp. NIES-54]
MPDVLHKGTKYDHGHPLSPAPAPTAPAPLGPAPPAPVSLALGSQVPTPTAPVPPDAAPLAPAPPAPRSTAPAPPAPGSPAPAPPAPAPPAQPALVALVPLVRAPRGPAAPAPLGPLAPVRTPHRRGTWSKEERRGGKAKEDEGNSAGGELVLGGIANKGTRTPDPEHRRIANLPRPTQCRRGLREGDTGPDVELMHSVPHQKRPPKMGSSRMDHGGTSDLHD